MFDELKLLTAPASPGILVAGQMVPVFPAQHSSIDVAWRIRDL
jgi:hypothetical protein